MCYVQRVINTCGHINDHVQMVCHLAKGATPSPDTSPTTCAFATKEKAKCKKSVCMQGQEPHTKRSSESKSQSQSQNQTQSQGQIQIMKQSSTTTTTHGSYKVARKGTVEVIFEEREEEYTEDREDMIQRTGFDARTEPYCISRVPRPLDSPCGFKCMVSGCGRAD
ncbi:uncharacterized protein BDV14DRAFT_195980 [Aspergillus stella-maris]|uniref:uncharacterized protein n=1 Tax=Aspergillus stella-maris TaxID=1810926 RepID=UPI003CCDFC55